MDRIEPGLYLGDIRDAADHEAIEAYDVGAALNVSRSQPDEPYPDGVAVAHVPLVDGPTNDYEDFAHAVDTLLALLEDDETTFVHCAAGVSRSVAVTTAALAVRDGHSIQDALDRVLDSRPVASPHPHLREQAEQYVQANQ